VLEGEQKKGIMNPLSPLTYYRRHKGQTLLLVGLITLVTLGIYVMGGVLESVLDTAYTTANYLTRFSRVYPAIGHGLDPAVVTQIRTHPGVARVIPENGLRISWPSLFGGGSFDVLGVAEADMRALVDLCDVRLREGRLLQARTNEIVLPEEIARALGLRLGDRIGIAIDKNYYYDIPTELVLVGILENDPAAGSGQGVLVGFVSYEYLEGHELYAPRPSRLLVVAREGHKEAVDAFLETRILSTYTEVDTHGLLTAFANYTRGVLYLVFGVVDCLVVVVIALVVGTINQIALTQRLSELGLLHAIGHQKNRLVRRLTLETVAVAGLGWIAGLVLSRLIFAWLKVTLYEPRGMELNLANLAPIWLTVPIPLAAIASTAFSILRALSRLDAVAIIERGRLGAEAREQRRGARRSRRTRSSARPLSSHTFYLRHRRRGVMLVGSTALMVLGIAFPAFFISPLIDAQLPFIEYLHQASVVSPGVGRAVDPVVTAQIRSHPSVARVIPAMPLSLMVSIPPTEAEFTFYGVSEDDLPALIDLYGVILKEGRLPRPRSNEIVLSEAVAVNRDLHLGDRVGRPVHKSDLRMPTEMVVVGILGARARGSLSGHVVVPGDIWLGFAPYEYLESHEFYSSRSVHLLVVPAGGRKAELDDWLEKDVASSQTNVRTYGTQYREIQQARRGTLLLFAALEGVIAVVAAIALAILNYIFFAQRREEFGVLHAMGRSRLWLVFRTLRETAGVAGLAWLIGAVACVTGLILAQASIYAPKGVSLDLTNPTPWLFTLPIPLTVVAASAGTIAWMFSKLDPVSTIERR
jgi:ABC-type lipoprotein release transport system permease subunit